MNKNNEKQQVYYMDENGYEELLNKIDEKRRQLRKACSTTIDGSSFNNSAFDAELDSDFALKHEQISNIKSELESLVAKLPNIQIVHKHNDEQLVDINDIILVSYTNSVDEKETIIRLVGGEPDVLAEISQVSLNSPIGKVIFGKPIGSTVRYTVGKNQFTLTIIEKLNKKLSR